MSRLLRPAWGPSQPLRTLFLDFDGVIMDSMALKLESYLFALADLHLPPAAVRKIQLASAGMSRQKTLPLMVRELAGREMEEAELAERLNRFRINDEASRARMKFMPRAKEFLATVKDMDFPTYILTGTPQEVIEASVDVFGLRPYFAGILGSPPDKATHLRSYCQELSLKPELCLFVGDSPQDQAAAKAVGLAFAGLAVAEEEARAFDPAYLHFRLKSLGDLWPALQA